MKEQIVRGRIRRVEPIHQYLTFVIIRTLTDDVFAEHKLPVYMRIPDLSNQLATVRTTRRGWFGRNVEQEISGINFSYSVNLSQSLINEVNANYSKRNI